MNASLPLYRKILLLLPAIATMLGGCASKPLDATPLEQLTVHFNADLTQHSGEYRLIRKDLQQRQCIWQLYVDGTLRSHGQLPLPSEGLSGLFTEATEALTSPGVTTQEGIGLDDQESYLVQITYQTPADHWQVQTSGSLARVARALQQSEQIFAIHRHIVSQLPQTYWFARLNATAPPRHEAVEARAR